MKNSIAFLSCFLMLQSVAHTQPAPQAPAEPRAPFLGEVLYPAIGMSFQVKGSEWKANEKGMLEKFDTSIMHHALKSDRYEYHQYDILTQDADFSGEALEISYNANKYYEVGHDLDPDPRTYELRVKRTGFLEADENTRGIFMRGMYDAVSLDDVLRYLQANGSPELRERLESTLPKLAVLPEPPISHSHNHDGAATVAFLAGAAIAAPVAIAVGAVAQVANYFHDKQNGKMTMDDRVKALGLPYTYSDLAKGISFAEVQKSSAANYTYIADERADVLLVTLEMLFHHGGNLQLNSASATEEFRAKLLAEFDQVKAWAQANPRPIEKTAVQSQPTSSPSDYSAP